MNISLNSSANVETFKEGEVIFKEGELPEFFYIIESGAVRCLRWNEKRLSPVFTAVAGELVGEDCVLSDSNHYFYSAVALEDCSLIKITKSEVFSFLNEQSPWVRSILDNISEKIEHTTELLAEHRIFDDRLLKNIEFTQEEEVSLKDKL